MQLGVLRAPGEHSHPWDHATVASGPRGSLGHSTSSQWHCQDGCPALLASGRAGSWEYGGDLMVVALGQVGVWASNRVRCTLWTPDPTCI